MFDQPSELVKHGENRVCFENLSFLFLTIQILGLLHASVARTHATAQRGEHTAIR